jgi:flagellar biosynthesis protein FlhB
LAQARTEPASPRRIADALAAGTRPISHDVTALFTVLAAGLVISQSALGWWQQWREIWMSAIEQIGQSSSRLDSLRTAVGVLLVQLLAPATAIVVVAVLAAASQGAMSFRSRSTLTFSVQRSPWLRSAWMLVKALVIVMALLSIVNASLRAVLSTATSDLSYSIRTLERLCSLSTSRLGIALALLVIADVIVERALWRHSLRMTRDELRRELRDIEGDPLVREERRRRQHVTLLEP